MPDIIVSRPGRVKVVNAGEALPGRVSVRGFSPQAALISGLRTAQSTNQQFQPSLSDAIYLYVFGDLMGDLQVSGKAMASCSSGPAHGIDDVFAFYKRRRVSSSSRRHSHPNSPSRNLHCIVRQTRANPCVGHRTETWLTRAHPRVHLSHL